MVQKNLHADMHDIISDKHSLDKNYSSGAQTVMFLKCRKQKQGERERGERASSG